MNEKINYKEILEQFIQKSGLSEEQAKNFIDTLQYVFLQAIEQEKVVKINGLGTFQLVWNNPRKSIDVRTQQEIEIAGHYKLSFTPENTLKNSVNAEFAHLMPRELVLTQSKKESPIEKLSQQAKDLKVIIDGIQQENNKVDEVRTNNLQTEQVDRVGEEQSLPKQIIEITETTESQEVEKVEEIEKVKNIIVEEKINVEEILEEIVIEKPKEKEVIEQIIEKPKEEEVIEQIIEKPKEEEVIEQIIEKPKEKEVIEQIIEKPKEKEVIEQIIEKKIEQPSETQIETELDEKELAQKQSAIDFFYQKPEQPIEVKANTFDYVENYEFKPKKRRGWLWCLISLIVLAAAVTAFYFLKPNLANEYWNKTTELTKKVSDWFSKPQNTDIQKDTVAIDTIQNNLDTIKPIETITTTDTSIFDETRTYKEFITSVRMDRGNTLVKLAEKYYGNKVFWVYIFEANKNKIADPNKIKSGLNVKIPKLDKKLIDQNNSACLEYAHGLHDEYLKK